MKLAKAISVRLLFGLLSLLFISLVTFVADEATPGDAATVLAGDKATQGQVQALRTQLGLDRPAPERYIEFVKNAATGNFGNSYFLNKEPVRDILVRKLPMTAKLAVLAILLASIVGITLGTVAAIWRERVPDKGILTLSTLGVTVPNFVLAPILGYFFAVYLKLPGDPKLGLLPLNYETPLNGPEISYLILPVAILASRPAALLTRLTRASMIETLQQEFIRTAIAKGVPRGRLYLKHALRNAILPVVTAIGTSFGFLLTGSFVVERAFTIPGIGNETIEAINQQNSPVVQGCVMVTGALFIVINLIVDLLLPLLDPRIRESQV